ncbi:hypothetical protein D3C76_1665870 [compost metagenome]
MLAAGERDALGRAEQQDRGLELIELFAQQLQLCRYISWIDVGHLRVARQPLQLIAGLLQAAQRGLHVQHLTLGLGLFIGADEYALATPNGPPIIRS